MTSTWICSDYSSSILILDHDEGYSVSRFFIISRFAHIHIVAYRSIFSGLRLQFLVWAKWIYPILDCNLIHRGPFSPLVSKELHHGDPYIVGARYWNYSLKEHVCWFGFVDTMGIWVRWFSPSGEIWCGWKLLLNCFSYEFEQRFCQGFHFIRPFRYGFVEWFTDCGDNFSLNVNRRWHTWGSDVPQCWFSLFSGPWCIQPRYYKFLLWLLFKILPAQNCVAYDSSCHDVNSRR